MAFRSFIILDGKFKSIERDSVAHHDVHDMRLETGSVAYVLSIMNHTMVWSGIFFSLLVGGQLNQFPNQVIF